MNKRRRAVTLLDIIAGVLVFLIGILAVIGSLPYILKSQQTTQKYTTALGLAEMYMGKIKSEAKTASVFDNLTSTYCANATTRNSISGYPGFYSGIQAINFGSADFKKITVVIYWTVGGVERKVTLVNCVRRKT